MIEKEELIRLLNAEQYEDAYLLIEHVSKEEITDAESAILTATVYENIGMREEAFQVVERGLRIDPCNYELYYMLGNLLVSKNIDQAHLCYENATFWCNRKEDIAIIQQADKELKENNPVRVRKTSIVIVTNNLCYQLQRCVESIFENNMLESLEVIVVDNASTDETESWLRKQKHIKWIQNGENLGFPEGCNRGIKIAEKENDIFLLNDDTRLTANALFLLRMALYDRQEN